MTFIAERTPGGRSARAKAALATLVFFACCLCFIACRDDQPDPDANQISAAERAAIAVAVAKISMCEGNVNGTAVFYYYQSVLVLSGAMKSEPLSAARKESMWSEITCLGSVSSCDEV